MATKFTIGVFGIIFDNDQKVLLCHRRDYDLWNLPGGGLGAKESPWEGVIREVKEETGLNIKISKLAGVYNKPNKNEIVFSFICKIASGIIKISDEADKIKYFEINKLPPNISSKQIERIRDAIENQDDIVFKTQTNKPVIELIKERKL